MTPPNKKKRRIRAKITSANIQNFIPMVHMIAQRIKSYSTLPEGMGYDDMVSVGLLGVRRAHELYDPTKGKLSTYVGVHVFGAIRHEIRKQSWMSGWIYAIMSKRKHIHSTILAAHCGPPMQQEELERATAKILGIDFKRYRRALARVDNRKLYSLDYEYSQDGEDTPPLRERIEDETTIDPLDAMIAQEQREQRERVMDSMDKRAVEVLMLRYYHHKTLRATGELMGLSPERIRQIEERAKKTMRIRIERDNILNGG